MHLRAVSFSSNEKCSLDGILAWASILKISLCTWVCTLLEDFFKIVLAKLCNQCATHSTTILFTAYETFAVGYSSYKTSLFQSLLFPPWQYSLESILHLHNCIPSPLETLHHCMDFVIGEASCI